MASSYVTQDFKCGYDGSLHFFKMNRVIQDVSFRVNDEKCMYFSFVLDNQPYTTQLTAEAKKLLETLKK